MKKIFALGLALVMTAAMGVTVFAANPSVTPPTQNNEVVAAPISKENVSKAVDANGKTVEVTVTAVSNAAALDALKNSVVLPANVAKVETLEVSVPAGTVFPVTLTFDFAEAAKVATKGVLHWNGSNWDNSPTVTNNQNSKLAVRFASLSPIAIEVGTANAATVNTDSTTGSSATNPKTADNGVLAIGIVAILALAGVAVIGRKRATI
ncbi:hypothetical protein FACS1894111_09480 [Clostridia bacterium]|nr:hypothetical protein FACS1894111_09480 [Clostridia bacterium]